MIFSLRGGRGSSSVRLKQDTPFPDPTQLSSPNDTDLVFPAPGGPSSSVRRPGSRTPLAFCRTCISLVPGFRNRRLLPKLMKLCPTVGWAASPTRAWVVMHRSRYSTCGYGTCTMLESKEQRKKGI